MHMEALIGAIYLDGGFANAKEFIHKFMLNDMEHKKLFYDSKTILQEIVQANVYGKYDVSICQVKKDRITTSPSKYRVCSWQERIRTSEAAVPRKQRSRMRHTRQF